MTEPNHDPDIGSGSGSEELGHVDYRCCVVIAYLTEFVMYRPMTTDSFNSINYKRKMTKKLKTNLSKTFMDDLSDVSETCSSIHKLISNFSTHS